MKIEVRISAIICDEKVKAYASACLDDKFIIDGIKVIEGKNGKFAAMPSRRSRDGGFFDVCFPITREFRQEINDAVITAYEKRLEEFK